MSFPNRTLCYFQTGRCVVSKQDNVSFPNTTMCRFRTKQFDVAETTAPKPPRRNLHARTSTPKRPRRNLHDETRMTTKCSARVNCGGYIFYSKLLQTFEFAQWFSCGSLRVPFFSVSESAQWSRSLSCCLLCRRRRRCIVVVVVVVVVVVSRGSFVVCGSSSSHPSEWSSPSWS